MNITNGASITSKSPKRMLTELRSTAAHGMMARLENGKLYHDWQAGLRGDIFGYSPEWWRWAVSDAVGLGPASSIAHQDERVVAELVTRLYPDIEAVRFMLNGSDPCAAAVKLARAITGREKILTYGYHGTASAYAAPPTPFDPDDNRLGTMQAEQDAYISVDWLGGIRGKRGMPNAAAIIVECPPVDNGKEKAKEWLHWLADGALEREMLFILDEVVTGFRYAPGGAAEYYDLLGKVDLYCFGKTLGNGFPISALAGKESVMQWLAEKPGGGGKVHWSNTFNGEPFGLAAAKATLQQLLDSPPWEHLYCIGDYLKTKWNELDLPWQLVGHSTRPVLQGPDEGLDDLRRHLFAQGHIVVKHPWFVSTATTEADVDDLVEKAVQGIHKPATEQFTKLVN